MNKKLTGFLITLMICLTMSTAVFAAPVGLPGNLKFSLSSIGIKFYDIQLIDNNGNSVPLYQRDSSNATYKLIAPNGQLPIEVTSVPAATYTTLRLTVANDLQYCVDGLWHTNGSRDNNAIVLTDVGGVSQGVPTEIKTAGSFSKDYPINITVQAGQPTTIYLKMTFVDVIEPEDDDNDSSTPIPLGLYVIDDNHIRVSMMGDPQLKQ